MRLKDLFTVTTGQKVTERYLHRVLISSICSILLCMSCLVGTTWAWFAVSIENTGNVIEIGKPEIHLTVGGSEYTSGTKLEASTIEVKMEHANKADDLNKKSTLYVTLTIQCGDEATTVYTTLNENNGYSAAFNIQNNTEKSCSVSWVVSWFAPANAAALTDDTVILTAEDPTEPSDEASTEPSAEATTQPSTEATETTAEPSTEPESQPEDASTGATNDGTTEPTAEETEPAA